MTAVQRDTVYIVSICPSPSEPGHKWLSPILLFFSRCPVEGFGPGWVIPPMFPLLHQDPPLIIVPVLFYGLPMILDSFTGWGWSQGVDPGWDMNQTHGAWEFPRGIGSVHGVGPLYRRRDGCRQRSARDLWQRCGSCHFGLISSITALIIPNKQIASERNEIWIKFSWNIYYTYIKH